jgi:hypothetical protein
VQLHELRTEALVDELRHPDRRLRRVEGEQECHRLGDHERLTDGGGGGVGADAATCSPRRQKGEG